MYDSGKIILGIIVLIVLITSPIWYNLASSESAIKPNIRIQVKDGQTECVTNTEYMRTSHMDLLNDWRDDVVRNGNRKYISETGKEYEMSLTKTCTNCHSNKSQFCDQCHDYVGVTPYCWNCHIEPVEMESEL
jgi:hypothetical protein